MRSFWYFSDLIRRGDGTINRGKLNTREVPFTVALQAGRRAMEFGWRKEVRLAVDRMQLNA